jgi:hypothetical protein
MLRRREGEPRIPGGHVGPLALAAVAAVAAACEVVAPIPDLTSGAGATEADAGGADAAADGGAGADADGARSPPACPPTALYCNPFEATSTLSDFGADTIGARVDPAVAWSGKSSLRLDRQ